MKKSFLLLLCLLMTLLLSSCHIHIDADPWPASPEQTVTHPPVTETITIAEPTHAEQPVVTEPASTEEFVPVVTPTPQPSNDTVEPGFNG